MSGTQLCLPHCTWADGHSDRYCFAGKTERVLLYLRLRAGTPSSRHRARHMACRGLSQSWARSPHLLLPAVGRLQLSHSGFLSLSLLNTGVIEAVERIMGNQTEAPVLTQGGVQPSVCPASMVRCSAGAPRWAWFQACSLGMCVKPVGSTVRRRCQGAPVDTGRRGRDCLRSP